ncbi:hypothetical protein ACJ41O_008504 [Fusarium nematophilum]
MSRPASFILPNSPSCRVLDRFSDLPDDAAVDEDDSGRIPFWPLLRHLLGQPLSTSEQLIDRLQTIAANAGTCQKNDFGSLKKFLDNRDTASQFFDATWPNLRDIALDLPVYSPDGQLELLQPGQPLRLSRGQTACLVMHQFLCSATPQRHDDGYQDLGIWYSSEQRHPAAVEMYLTALFAYFEGLPEAHLLMKDHETAADDAGNHVVYELHRNGEDVSLQGTKLAPVQVHYLDAHTTDTHNPEAQGADGAAVVSANKVIGFGQSATQEEIFVGIAPEAYPIVLVAPQLEDGTVVTLSGARAMVSVTGQRRDITWRIRPPPAAPAEGFEAWKKTWHGGRLVFMDALEMDMLEPSSQGSLPDLEKENIDREIRKASAGFTSIGGDAVFTGLWGCGAFGGDPGVKLVVLWLAAAAARVRIHVLLGPGEHGLGSRLERVVRACDEGTSVPEAVQELLSKVPGKLRREGILEWIEGALSGVP